MPHRHKFLLVGLGAGVLLLAGAMAAFAILLSGAYSTAATKQHFAVTYWVLDLGLRYSVKASASDVSAPDLSAPGRIGEGLACYREFCVQCHGAPGVARDELAQGMLPSPSSLAQSARDWPAEHLYHVIKQGVRMTGMPAWEFRIADDGLWSTTAFLKQMPFMTREQYELLAISAKAACPRNLAPMTEYTGEDAKVVLYQYACHNCHRIDGLVGPDTHVGPPLTQWSRRGYIAGTLPNTVDNLVRWIVDPRSVSPHTLMPDLEVPEAQARQMAVYLMERRR